MTMDWQKAGFDVRKWLCTKVDEALELDKDVSPIDPSRVKIDKLVSHDILDVAQTMDPLSVYDVAREYGFMITSCCEKDCAAMQPNGLWLEILDDEYHNTTDSYCPSCREAFDAKIAARRAAMKRAKAAVEVPTERTNGQVLTFLAEQYLH